jgi:3-methyladenine DNA glycosylase AlkD
VTHPAVRAIRKSLRALADLDRAKGAQAYMKTTQPFYGVQTPQRRKLVRDVLGKHPLVTRADYESVVRTLWHGKYREEMYCALDVAEQCTAFRTNESWPLYEELLRSATNWDTVDFIATRLLGGLVLHDRTREKTIKRWVHDPNFWVRRVSLLVRLKHKRDTNTTLLGETIVALMDEKEFFIRKAIGWVLREYAKTDPEWVRAFVRKHGGRLSPLSKREATKHL